MGGKAATTSSDPWDGAKGALGYLYYQGQKNAKADQGSYYKGDFLAGQSNATKNARAGLRGKLEGQQGGMDGSIKMLQDTISGKFLNGSPALSGAMNAATRPVTERLTRSTLPGLDSAAISGGAYGGSANALMKGQAIADTQRSVMDTRATMLDQNYSRERGYQMAAPSSLEGAMQASLRPSQGLLADALMGEQYDQKALDNSFQKWNAKDMSKWTGLQRLQGILSGAGGLGGTSTTGGSNKMGGAMGGASMGLTAGLGAVGALGMTNPYTIAPTLIAAALLGGGAGYAAG